MKIIILRKRAQITNSFKEFLFSVDIPVQVCMGNMEVIEQTDYISLDLQ